MDAGAAGSADASPAGERGRDEGEGEGGSGINPALIAATATSTTLAERADGADVVVRAPAAAGAEEGDFLGRSFLTSSNTPTPKRKLSAWAELPGEKIRLESDGGRA